jgi:hypothetical protein
MRHAFLLAEDDPAAHGHAHVHGHAPAAAAVLSDADNAAIDRVRAQRARGSAVGKPDSRLTLTCASGPPRPLARRAARGDRLP